MRQRTDIFKQFLKSSLLLLSLFNIWPFCKKKSKMGIANFLISNCRLKWKQFWLIDKIGTSERISALAHKNMYCANEENYVIIILVLFPFVASVTRILNA